MGRSVNKITLLGNVGRDPDIRSTGSGVKVASLSLATSWKKKDGTEMTQWHRLTAWDKLADIVEQYVKKGDRLYVEGSLEYGSYDKEGVAIPTADIRLTEVVLLGNKAEAF